MSGLTDFVLTHETVLRLGTFFGLLVVFFILEQALPRRRQNVKARHYAGNLALGGLNIVLLRFILPGGLVGLAMLRDGGGLMGALAWPPALQFIACLVVLDMTLYGQHRLLHKVDFLWRWHAPHHGDRDLNVASGVRFHPGEAVFSLGVKAAAIWLLGAPVAAVILFEVLLSGAALFNHANWSLGRADKWLRLLIVTPDMHRLHHSRHADETQKNFGFFLSVWDRLFSSYQDEPRQAHTHIPLGLDEAPDDGLAATLVHPFRKN